MPFSQASPGGWREDVTSVSKGADPRRSSMNIALPVPRIQEAEGHVANPPVPGKRHRNTRIVFGRVHLRALIRDPGRTVLSIVGVALGVALVLGVTILRAEMSRPFDAFGPTLTAAAEGAVLQITPAVSGRLPENTFAELAAVDGVVTAVPVVAGLTPIGTQATRKAGQADTGAFLLGTTCDVEQLVGSFDCEARAAEDPAPGPGVPLVISRSLSEALQAKRGDEIVIPGLPEGSAHIGWIFDQAAQLEDVNSGFVAFAPTPEAAAGLLGTPGYLTNAFLLPEPGVDVAGRLADIVSTGATVTPPEPQVPVLYATTQESLNLTATGGFVIGVLIAINTILLAIEDRRAVMGTIGAIGARPRRVFAGFLGEGALIGAVGGMLAVPFGFLLGMFLVDRFGAAILQGSGAQIAATWDWALVATGLAAGTLCGVIAVLGPARRLVRGGVLDAMAGRGGSRRSRNVPFWPLPLGLVMIGAAVWVLQLFSRGELELSMGNTAMFLGILGLTALLIWLVPPIAVFAARLLSRWRPDVGRLLRADLQRYVMLFGATVTVLAIGTSLAIGFQSVEVLGADQLGALKAKRLSDAVVVSTQELLAQRDGMIAEPVYQKIIGAAGGRDVQARYRAVIPSPIEPRIVVGVEPGSWYADALVDVHGDADTMWRAMANGQVALSEVAAGHLAAAPGDTVTVQTPIGGRKFTVAGIFTPVVANDSVVGDWIMVDAKTAQQTWGAQREQVAILYESTADADAHVADYEAIGDGLRVYDDAGWTESASMAAGRYFEPYAVTGYVIMIAAGVSVVNMFLLGLVQRRRERAALRAIGMTVRTERRVIVAQALLLAMLAACFGVLSGFFLNYMQTLLSPVYYGFTLEWAVAVRAVYTGAVGVFVLAGIAAIFPLVHAGRLEAVDVLRQE